MEKEERLEDLLLEYDSDELLENAYIMGYNDDGEMDDLDTESMARRLAKAVLSDPLPVLRRLPLEDLQLLQMLVDAEPGMGMKNRNTTQQMAICRLGLACETEWDKEEDIYMIYITDDFRAAILPHIDQVLDDFDVKFRLYVEQYIVGALNIYGLLTKKELKKILKQCIELTDDGSRMFDNVYHQSITMKIYENFTDDGEPFFISPFVHDYDEILETRKEHPELKAPKHFSREKLREAGEMPVSYIPNPYADKLMKMLTTKLGFDEQEAYFNMFMVWRMSQYERMSPVAVVQHLIDLSKGKVRGVDMLNQIMGVLMNYMNHAPRWGFYGRCPADISKDLGPMTTPPVISLGSNARKMGYTQKQVQDMVDDLWDERMNPAAAADPFDVMIPHIALPKVGRNDPCPCGSGKKYKNCCGRGN